MEKKQQEEQSWTEVVKGKRKGREQGSGTLGQEVHDCLTEEGEEDMNESLAALREGRRLTSTPRRSTDQIMEGDWRCKD